jgi:hypothetical protein
LMMTCTTPRLNTDTTNCIHTPTHPLNQFHAF